MITSNFKQTFNHQICNQSETKSLDLADSVSNKITTNISSKNSSMLNYRTKNCSMEIDSNEINCKKGIKRKLNMKY